MSIFQRKPVKQEPAASPPPAPSSPPVVQAKPKVDQELVDMLGAEKPKKTREGALLATAWRAAELHWRQCRNFTEVAERAGVTTSAVARMAKKRHWVENLGREGVTDMRESQAAIVARVNEQVARLQPEDREALCSAIRADHAELAVELKTRALEALERLGIDRVVDAIRILDLGVSIEQNLLGDKTNDHRSLTLVLQQQREKFAVKPKIKVSEGGDA